MTTVSRRMMCCFLICLSVFSANAADTLRPGEQLGLGGRLDSATASYRFQLQGDGNLVLSRQPAGTVLFRTVSLIGSPRLEIYMTIGFVNSFDKTCGFVKFRKRRRPAACPEAAGRWSAWAGGQTSWCARSTLRW